MLPALAPEKERKNGARGFTTIPLIAIKLLRRTGHSGPSLAGPEVDESRQEQRSKDVQQPVLAREFAGGEVQDGP